MPERHNKLIRVRSVCKDCPKLIPQDGQRWKYPHDCDIVKIIDPIKVPRDCPRYLEQVVMGQPK